VADRGLYIKLVVMLRAENLIFSIVLIFSTFPVHFYHSIHVRVSLSASNSQETTMQPSIIIMYSRGCHHSIYFFLFHLALFFGFA
jgi:hypothetical protein